MNNDVPLRIGMSVIGLIEYHMTVSETHSQSHFATVL